MVWRLAPKACGKCMVKTSATRTLFLSRRCSRQLELFTDSCDRLTLLHLCASEFGFSGFIFRSNISDQIITIRHRLFPSMMFPWNKFLVTATTQVVLSGRTRVIVDVTRFKR